MRTLRWFFARWEAMLVRPTGYISDSCVEGKAATGPWSIVFFLYSRLREDGEGLGPQGRRRKAPLSRCLPARYDL